MVGSKIWRLAWTTIGIICLSWLAMGCGEEEAPEAENLTLREMLGMAPERMSEAPQATQRALLSELEGSWEQAIGELNESRQVSLTDEMTAAGPAPYNPLEFVRLYDFTRVERSMNVAPIAHIDADDESAQVESMPLPPEALGLNFNERLSVTELGEDEPHYSGVLHYEGWSDLEDDGYPGGSQLAAAQGLEPAARRLLFQVGLADELSAQIVAAPRAPLALWYAKEHRALLVNPNLLFLLDLPEGAEEGDLQTVNYGLEMAYVDQCVDEEFDRCVACFGENGDPSDPSCSAYFDTSLSPQAECEWLMANELNSRLFCYNAYIELNEDCYLSTFTDESCGTAGYPYGDIESLSALSALDQTETCQVQLDRCEDSRLNPEDVDSDLPPAVNNTSSSSSSSNCTNQCLEAGCEIGAQVLLQIACQVCLDEAVSDGCEGDGLMDPEENPEEDKSTQVAAGVLFSFPFFLLAGAWYVDRRQIELVDEDEEPHDEV